MAILRKALAMLCGISAVVGESHSAPDPSTGEGVSADITRGSFPPCSPTAPHKAARGRGLVPCPSPRRAQARLRILGPGEEVLQRDPPDPLLLSQIHDHAAPDGGSERLHVDADLCLDQRPVCRLEVDPHAVDLVPATGGLEHPVTHTTDEDLSESIL